MIYASYIKSQGLHGNKEIYWKVLNWYGWPFCKWEMRSILWNISRHLFQINMFSARKVLKPKCFIKDEWKEYYTKFPSSHVKENVKEDGYSISETHVSLTPAHSSQCFDIHPSANSATKVCCIGTNGSCGGLVETELASEGSREQQRHLRFLLLLSWS